MLENSFKMSSSSGSVCHRSKLSLSQDFPGVVRLRLPKDEASNYLHTHYLLSSFLELSFYFPLSFIFKLCFLCIFLLPFKHLIFKEIPQHLISILLLPCLSYFHSFFTLLSICTDFSFSLFQVCFLKIHYKSNIYTDKHVKKRLKEFVIIVQSLSPTFQS